MSQVKIYGLEEHLERTREALSDTIHECVVEALQFPKNKRAHRFIPLKSANFYMPEGRTEKYTILEIAMIAGRSKAAKKELIRLLFEKIEEKVGIEKMDLEICIFESPAENWGFRGMHGDEIQLSYRIDV